MKFVIVSLFLMTYCHAVENTTEKILNNSTKSQEQLNIQKREKQCIIEDIPVGPEQIRNGRQSIPFKTNPKTLKIQMPQRVLPVQIKQIVQPVILQNPRSLSIDANTQRIPPKVPVIFKTPTVVPVPVHPIRQIILDRSNNTTPTEPIKHINLKTGVENASLPDPLTLYKDKVPFTIEYKLTPQTDTRESPNSPEEDTPRRIGNGNLNRDGKQTIIPDIKIPVSKNSRIIQEKRVPNVGRKVSQSVNSRKFDRPSEVKPRLINFFEDVPDRTPPSVSTPSKIAKNKDVTPNKINEYPFMKNISPKKDKFEDPNDVIRISNGTHVISIKKIRNPDRYKTQQFEQESESRIINNPNQSENNPGFSVKEEKIHLSGPLHGAKKTNQDKDENDCITITDHNYEELEEKVPVASAPIKPIYYNEMPVNYLQDMENAYQLCQNVYDDFGNNAASRGQPFYGQGLIDPRNAEPPNDLGITEPVFNTENMPTYNVNDKLVPFPDVNQYTTYTFTGKKQNENDYAYTPEVPVNSNSKVQADPEENNSDKIRRTWKDVEIKIKRPPNDGVLDIDIRRNMVEKIDGKKGNLGSKPVSSYIFSPMPINYNSYFPSQNIPISNPYFPAGYRYMH